MKQVIENDRIIKEIQGEWERKMRREDEEKKSKGQDKRSMRRRILD